MTGYNEPLAGETRSFLQFTSRDYGYRISIGQGETLPHETRSRAIRGSKVVVLVDSVSDYAGKAEQLNAIEIEEAISQLADQPFDRENFPYAFLEAFGNKETTIKRLRAGASNKSDVGGVLQTNNIHIATCDKGQVTKTLTALRKSPATAKAKAKFILATDGVDFEAEDLVSGETVAVAYNEFPDRFSFFLPLAGITTVKQIKENAFDIRATSRLNRLYVELLKDNHAWSTAERRHGAADLLLLRRAHRHLQWKLFIHRYYRTDERQGLVQHP
jgi:hypothetical protein